MFDYAVIYSSLFLLMDACLLQDGKLCSSDDTLPDGLDVRRGDKVMYLPYPMGRMKFLWGGDAEVFRPERWLNNDGVFQPESPFKFTAFQVSKNRKKKLWYFLMHPYM